MPKSYTLDTELELLNLEPVQVSLENVYLDPNNPRFIEMQTEPVPEERIKEQSIQEKLLHWMKERIGIEDLLESIKRYGFLKADRIIVKPLDEESFVVIEGNRRVAALKVLNISHKHGEITLHQDVLSSIKTIEALVYRGNRSDIAWIIQGLRHLTGIKGWPRLQQAKFVTENFYEERRMGFREIAKLLGMKSTEVGVMIRSYYAYRQAKEDEEFGEFIGPEKFSIFQEAVFKKPILKTWLGWDDRTKRFQNTENFRKFLSWITPNEDGEIKIERALDVRDILSKLILDEHKSILERFENGEITIFEAHTEIERTESREETERATIDVNRTLQEIEKLYRRLSTLPIPQIISDREAVQKLRELFAKIKIAIQTYEQLFSE